MIPLTGQLVDTCAYPPAHGRPDGRLSMLYARFGVPDNERIRMQESYKDAFRFSMIASSFDAVPAAVATILGDALPGTGDADHDTPETQRLRNVSITNWKAVWSQCSQVRVEEEEFARRSRADPHNVAEIPQADLASMWRSFAARHADILLVPATKCHPKAIDRYKRDFIVHGLWKHYELGECWLESDPLEPQRGWARSVDDLPKIASHIDSVVVNTEESALRRIRSRWFGAELVGAAQYTIADGPLAYVHAIEKEANEASNVNRFSFIVRFDRLLSKEIYDLQCRDPTTYRSLSLAMLHVLEHDKDRLRDRAIMSCYRQAFDDAVANAQHTPAAPHVPSAPSAPPPPDLGADPGPATGLRTKSAKAKKAARRRANNAAILKAAKTSQGAGATGKGAAAPANPKGKGAGKGPPIPKDEWATICSYGTLDTDGTSRICRYYNSSIGCKKTGCKFVHKCLKCKQKHPLFNNH